MTIDTRPIEPIGNPIRRDLLLRTLRSNTTATILYLWTVLVAAVGAFVLIDQVGLTRPFEVGSADPTVLGRALSQWWVLAITCGMLLLGPITTVSACAAHGEHQRLNEWTMTLVGPWRVVWGIWQRQVAVIALALALALPVAGLALAAGGTSPAQLGVGIIGAAAVGLVSSALSMAVACRSRRMARPLVAIGLILVALHVVPFVLHQSDSTPSPNRSLAAIPAVAIADAAAPRAPGAPRNAGAADAPLEHLAANVADPGGGDAMTPPWAWTALGAAIVTLGSLIVARLRITRPARP